MATEKKKIKASEVIALLDKGYSRYKKADKGEGSVQAHYELSTKETKRLFETPSLKYKKRIPTGSVSFEVEEEGEGILGSLFPIPSAAQVLEGIDILSAEVLGKVEEELDRKPSAEGVSAVVADTIAKGNKALFS